MDTMISVTSLSETRMFDNKPNQDLLWEQAVLSDGLICKTRQVLHVDLSLWHYAFALHKKELNIVNGSHCLM